MTRLEMARMLTALAEDRLNTCEFQVKTASKISTPMWKVETERARELVDFAKSVEALMLAEFEAVQ